MLRVRSTRALVVAAAALASGCPAPDIDPNAADDVMPYDAHAIDEAFRNPSGPPTCSPEGIVDVNARGVRYGNTVTIDVDTRGARNDVHPTCATSDGPEVVLRYTVPPLSQAAVRAVRITTITAATMQNDGSSEIDTTVPDPTTYDTVLSIRLACDARDIDCNNDGFVQDGFGQAVQTRRSTVYLVDTNPEDVALIVVDGFDGGAGIAHVTFQELPQLGVLGAPCVPIPFARINDPTAPTAYFRCPHPGIECLPSAGADGTDLCVPIVPLGGRCDSEHRFDVCDRADQGVECAQNPSATEQVVCAMPGTAAGTSCRGLPGSTNRCDAGLYCEPTAEPDIPDICVPVRHANETCDPTPTGAINHCDTGLVCCLANPEAGTDTMCEPAGTAGCATSAGGM